MKKNNLVDHVGDNIPSFMSGKEPKEKYRKISDHLNVLARRKL